MYFKNHDILAAFHLKNLMNSITFRRTSSHRSLRIWADLGAEKWGFPSVGICWDVNLCIYRIYIGYIGFPSEDVTCPINQDRFPFL